MQRLMGSLAKPRKLGNFARIFVLKVALQSLRLLLDVTYRKKIRGGKDVLVAPQ